MNHFYSKDHITIYNGQAEEIRRGLTRKFSVLLIDGPGNYHADTVIEWLPWVAIDGTVIVMGRDSVAMIGPHGDFKNPPWVKCPELTPAPGYTHFAARPASAIQSLLELTDGIILDPYMGVGSTLLAAKLLKRHAVGIERDKNWCAIAAARLEAEQ